MKKSILFLNTLFVLFLLSSANAQNQVPIDSLLQLLKKYKSPCSNLCIKDTVKVNLLNDISNVYHYNAPDSAIFLSTEALSLANELKWQVGIGESYYYTANAYYQKGDYNFAIDNYLKSLIIWQQIENSNLPEKAIVLAMKKPITLKNIAGTYVAQGNYLKALNYLFEALKLAEKSGNKDVIGGALGDIGLVYRKNQNYEKAIDYYNRSLKMFEETKNENLKALLLGNIGSLYYYKNEYDKSLEYAYKSLTLHEKLNQQSGIARQLSNIGNNYYDKKEYDSALKYYFKAKDIQKANNYKYELGICLGNIGLVYKDIKNYSQAEIYLKEALTLSENTGDVEGIKENSSTLSILFSNMGNYQKALEYYKKMIEAKDSLFNEENTAEITRKEMNYLFDKRQDSVKAAQDKKDITTQAELSKQKLIRNSIIGGAGALAIIGFLGFINFRNKRKREKAELSQQVSETEMKALRAQMNPHFLFNALGSIQSFLLYNQPDDANNYLLKFKELVRLVLENSQHKEVSLSEDIKALELYMQLESIRLQHPFSYQFHIDENVDIEQVVIPPLILQPFVENAIWHGLQPKENGNGHIDIFIKQSGDNLQCVVEDNGVGRSTSTTVSKTPFKKESLGIKLTEQRLKIINEIKKAKAYFNITDLFSANNKPCGTRVEMMLPLL